MEARFEAATYGATIATQIVYLAIIATQIGYVATIATQSGYVATLRDRNICATLSDPKKGMLRPLRLKMGVLRF